MKTEAQRRTVTLQGYESMAIPIQAPTPSTLRYTHTPSLLTAQPDKEPLSPPDLQGLGQAGSLSLSFLSGASLPRMGCLYAFRLPSETAAGEQQPDVPKPLTEGATVCAFLDLDCRCLQSQFWPPSPDPSDAEKGPERD